MRSILCFNATVVGDEDDSDSETTKGKHSKKNSSFGHPVDTVSTHTGSEDSEMGAGSSSQKADKISQDQKNMPPPDKSILILRLSVSVTNFPTITNLYH